MRKSSLFWGSLIIIIGLVLLINNLFPNINLHRFLWPGALILLGLWFLLRPNWKRASIEVERVSLPLEDLRSAEITFQHGAGRLTLAASARPATLLEGEFAGGVRVEQRRSGESASLRLRSAALSEAGVVLPGLGGDGLTWNLGLTREIPLRLHFETGACEAAVDLADLLVEAVHLQTGASRTEMTLPARAGHTRVEVESGLAGVVLKVPQGVAARVNVSSGLAGIKVAERFPRHGAGYLSPDFDEAANKVEISIETGLGSVEII